jgi:glycogen synthase
MKILAILFHFPPMSGGGVIVAVDIVNNFAKLGHKVTVITPNIEWSGPKFEAKIDSSIEIIRIDVPSKTKIKIAARRCKKNLQKKGEELGKTEQFDFVFTIFHPFHLAPSAAVACAKKLKIPSIIKIDDAIYEKSTGLKSIQRKIEKIMNAKTLQNSSKILVVNEEVKKIVIDYYNIQNEKILVIPNGVEISLFKGTKTYDKKLVLFSGVMYKHRGIDVLLEAAPKVIEKVPEAKFILLGDGDEMNEMKNIANQKKIAKNIIFTGWINRDKIPQELKNASIGIGPLKLTTVTKNALPIKVLEYMASGLPIIAKRGTLPKDILDDGKNGFFIDNVKELEEKLILLLNNLELNKQMSKKSIEMIQKFSWEKIIESIIQIHKN